MGSALAMLEMALALIELHGLDGRAWYINPEYVVSVAEPKGEGDDLLTDKANCVVTTIDRKFLTVRESCVDVLKLLGRTK